MFKWLQKYLKQKDRIFPKQASPPDALLLKFKVSSPAGVRRTQMLLTVFEQSTVTKQPLYLFTLSPALGPNCTLLRSEGTL